MKKKCIPPLLWDVKTHGFAFPKVPIVMKSLFYAYLLSSAGLLYASDTYSQTTMVSINMNNHTVKEVLDEIENTTEYSFFYNNSHVDLNRKVSVDVSNGDILEVLDDVFSGTNVSYTVKDKSIIFSVKEQSPAVSQDEKKITGTIVDATGTPIIGANVMVKGTTNGTITDLDGKFTLNVPAGAVLQVSYIGYANQEVKVGNSSNLSITLKEDTELLDEVVVIGYGTVKKSDLTGAVASVGGGAIEKRKTTQLSTALQGAVSGLTVTRNGSAPGSGASSLMIRGVTTIGDSSPLVIVDGVPGSIDQVSPNDVENITVLKDAASASIYGSRAASGVILITTKRANEKELSLNYTADFTLEIPTLQPEFVGINRFLAMANELRYNDNPTGGLYQAYSEEQQNYWMELNKQDPDSYPITNWYDMLINKNSFRQNHSVNISGGTKNVKSKVSLNYNDADALYDGYFYQRVMLRSNNDFTISKILGARIDFNWIHSKTESPMYNPFVDEGARWIPEIYPAIWTNGGYAGEKGGYNPYASLKDGGFSKNWGTQIKGKAELFLTPFKGLRLSAIVAPSYNFSKSKSLRKSIQYVSQYDPNQYVGYIKDHNSTDLNESRNDSYNITSQFLINYSNNFKDHTVNVTGGYENYYSFYENLGASRQQYLLDTFPYLNMGPEDFQFNSGSADHYAYRSWFGRIIYGYKSKYLLQANIRLDGSSRFAKGYQWGSFPSFSLGWVVSEENFMKNLKDSWLNNLKLRVSYGNLGNERIGGYHPYQGSLNFGTNLLYDEHGVVNAMQSAAQWNYAVRNISWETTTTYDVGLDLAMFNNRLSLSFDYYRKNTKDMLLATQIPGIVGYGNPSVNAGKMYTKGFDLDLGWRDNIGQLNYRIDFNLSDFVSRMGDLNGTEFLGSQIKKEGSEFNEWYGYVSDGLFLTQEDVDNSPKLNHNAKVGDIKYKDISGPEGIPDGKISPEYDRVLLGGSLPRFSFGANVALDYKDFDFSFSLQGIGKQNKMLSTAMVQPYRNNWMKIPEIIDGKYWSSFNTDEQNEKAIYPRLTSTNASFNYTTSDYWMFNGRYLRLKNITLGYTLPSRFLNYAFVKGLRVYISANDLFCISSYPKGWDPEMGSTSYPITTSLIFGASINF